MSAILETTSKKPDRFRHFAPALREDPHLRGLLPQVLQLKTCANQVRDFMNLVVDTCKTVNESVRTCLAFTFRMAKNTGCYPSAEFEVTGKEGNRLIIHTSGSVTPLLQLPELTSTQVPDSLPTCEEEPPQILFDGIDGVAWTGYAALQRQIGQDHLNSLCVEDFLNADDRLCVPWDLDRLFLFFATHGNHRWIAPIRDIHVLERSIKHIDRIRHDILDLMVNAGHLGFCPTQFLRKVIRPQIKKFKTSRDLHRTIDPMFRMLSRIHKRIDDAGGDGSAANIFTLKYFAHNIAQPTSKLLLKGFYDARGPSHRVFDELGDNWCRLFTEADDHMKNIRAALIRSYVHPYLNALVRIENPYEIRNGFNMATEHLLRVSEGVTNSLTTDQVYSVFHFTLHWQAFDDLEQRLGPTAAFLKMIIKHMEVVEGYVSRGNYGSAYLTYLRLLGTGAFEKPEDIDFYLDISSKVAPDKTGNADGIEFLSQMIKQARSPEARCELLEFMENSRFLEDSVFRAWKQSQPEDRESLLAAIDVFYRQFLCEPALGDAALPGNIDREQLKTAVIASLVRSSGLSKKMIVNLLGECDRDLPGIPKAINHPQHFEIKKHLRSCGDYSFTPSDSKYLQKKLKIVSDATVNAALPQHTGSLLLTMTNSALAKRASILGRINELRSDGNRLLRDADDNANKIVRQYEKKRNGLESQIVTLNAFAAFLKSLAGFRNLQPRTRQLAIERALVYLSYDKSFRKKEADSYAALAVAFECRGLDEYARTLSPWSDLASLAGKDAGFTYNTICSLEKVLILGTSQYFAQLFNDQQRGLPPGISVNLDRLLEQVGLKHLIGETAIIKADFFYRIFTKGQGVTTITNLKRTIFKAQKSGDEKLKIAFVPARDRMDMFFGAVGENCTASHHQEIRRREFVPVRIVNLQEGTLEGYIHLLEVKEDEKRYLVVPGIEPKTSFIDHLDAREFYICAKKAVARWAYAGGYAAALFPTNCITWSNRPSILALMERDIIGKQTIEIPGRRFPENAYHVSPAVPFWSNPEA